MGKLTQKVGWTVLGLLISSAAQAGAAVLGAIAFVPANLSIPTLSNPLLILLGVLMAVIATRVIRSGSGVKSKLTSVLLVSSGVLLSGYGIENSLAGGGASISVHGTDCNTGGTLNFDPNVNPAGQFINGCSGPLRITAITTSCTIQQTGTCIVGLVVPAGASCDLPTCGQANL